MAAAEPDHSAAPLPPAADARSWLCLTLPRLALDLIERISAKTEAHARPQVVIDGPEQRAQVHLADARAQALGVRSGQRLAAALALAPDLLRWRRDRLAEDRGLEHLAAWAYSYSSRVSIDGHNGLLLEVAASARLFGGIDALLAQMLADLQMLGFEACYGFGATPAAARLRARVAGHDPVRCGQMFALDEVALEHSGLDSRSIATLAGIGVHRVGQLRKLPRTGLARRCGQDTLDYLGRLDGTLPEALPGYQPPPRYHAWLELPAACSSSEALAFPLKRMLADLCALLRARDGGVERFSLRFALETAYASSSVDGSNSALCRLDIGLLAASRDADHLFGLVRARLERMHFPRPVQGIHLEVARLPSLVPLPLDLFDDARRGAAGLAPLYEKLSARLGEQALLRPLWIADHRPEYASLWRPQAELGASARTLRQAHREDSESAPPRPLWLLPEPLPIDPAGLVLLSHGERIESGWWDENDIRRDYYRAEVRDPARCGLRDPHPCADGAKPPSHSARGGFQPSAGAQAWVYQDLRLQRWFLHGWFG